MGPRQAEIHCAREGCGGVPMYLRCMLYKDKI
jgi:hypothetical protein